MEEKIEQAYLYDFYGELLNEHQRKIYEDFVFNDLSLGEIADEEGISRQGVHDMVKRCTKTLEGYESKLHLIEKFQTARGMVTKIHTLTKEFYKNHDEAVLEEIEQISNQRKSVLDSLWCRKYFPCISGKCNAEYLKQRGNGNRPDRSGRF